MPISRFKEKHLQITGDQQIAVVNNSSSSNDNEGIKIIHSIIDDRIIINNKDSGTKSAMIMEAESFLENNENLQYYSTNDRQFHDCSVRLTHSHLIVQIHQKHCDNNPSSIKSTSDNLLIPLDYITNAYCLDEVITDWSQLYNAKLVEVVRPSKITMASERTTSQQNNDKHPNNLCASINDIQSSAVQIESKHIASDFKPDIDIIQQINSDNSDGSSSTVTSSTEAKQRQTCENNAIKQYKHHQEDTIITTTTEYLYISIYLPLDYCSNKGLTNNRFQNNNVIILAFKPNTTENIIRSSGQSENNDDNTKHQIDVAHEDLTNTNGVEQWIDAIMPLARSANKLDKIGYMENVSKLISSNQENKKILIMLNPFGGKKKAMRIFKKKVLPMLIDSNVGYELFITQRANDARDFLVNSETIPTRWRSIVVLSGDGLFHEVVNGLMFRSDWQEAMSVPLGIIPAGSGNGLAYSLINRDYPDLTNKDIIALSTMNVIRGQTSQADLVRVSTNADTYWSFLSVGWGLLADIDIESERFRMLGEVRFTIWSIYRAVCSKTYRGKLSYQLAGRNDEQQEFNNGLENQISDLKPNNWIEVEDNFVCVYAAYQTHISSDVKLVPNARLSDGTIALLYLTGKLSSSQIINFLISMKTGAHVDLPYVRAVDVKSFKLEPLDESLITVDGELIPWQVGPIHVEVVPNLARFICKPQTPNK